MQFKFEITTEGNQVIRNPSFTSARTVDPVATPFSSDSIKMAYWEQGDDVPFAAPYTNSQRFIQLEGATGVDGGPYFIKLAQFVSPGAPVNELTLKQPGILKVGRDYDLTVKTNAVAGIGTDPISFFGLSGRYTTNPPSAIINTHTATFTATSADYSVIAREFASPPDGDLQITEIKCIEQMDWLEIDEPIDWQNASINLERSDTYKGIFRKFSEKVTFYGEAFDVIRDIFDRVGDQAFVKIRISYRCGSADSWTVFHNGISFMQDAVFTCNTVEVNIEGDNLADRLLRYDGYEVDLLNPIAPNGIGYTGITTYAVNHYLSGLRNRDGIFPYHAFEKLAEIFSDGDILIDAPQFEHAKFAAATNKYGQVMLASGTQLTNYVLAVAPLTFRKLFESIDKLFNIYAYIYESGGSVYLRVADYEDSFGSSQITLSENLYGVQELKQSIFDTIRYSGLRVGYQTYDSTSEDKPERFFSFVNNNGNGQILDKTNEMVASKYLADTQSGATSPADNDEDTFLTYIDAANTTPLVSENSAFANYNDSLSVFDIGKSQVKKLYDATYAQSLYGEIDQWFSTTSKIKYIFEFQFPLKLEDFLAIEADINNYIEFSPDDGTTTYEGYVQKLQFNVGTGLTEFELLVLEDVPSDVDN